MFYWTLWHYVRLIIFRYLNTRSGNLSWAPQNLRTGLVLTRWVIISYRSWQEFSECSDPNTPAPISHFPLKLEVLLSTTDKKVWNPHPGWNRGAHRLFHLPGIAWAVCPSRQREPLRACDVGQTLYVCRDQDQLGHSSRFPSPSTLMWAARMKSRMRTKGEHLPWAQLSSLRGAWSPAVASYSSSRLEAPWVLPGVATQDHQHSFSTCVSCQLRKSGSEGLAQTLALSLHISIGAAQEKGQVGSPG